MNKIFKAGVCLPWRPCSDGEDDSVGQNVAERDLATFFTQVKAHNHDPPF